MKRAVTLLSLCFVVLLVFVDCGVYASEVFHSYPLVLFNQHSNEPVTRKSSLHFTATSFHNAYSETLSRSKSIVLPYEEFIARSDAFLRGEVPEIQSSVMGDYQKTIAGGSSALIILLPEHMDDSLVSAWRDAESLLYSQPMIIPVYFIYENEDIHEILDTIESVSGDEEHNLPEKVYNSVFGDNFQFTVSTKEPSVLKKVTASNLQGWLAGNGDVNSPTIAIVANYDALSASPQLSKSAKSSASSTAILLELARLYNKLYSQPKTQSKYNILFVLTSGGHFNYYGSKHWLNEVDERLVKSLEFVICLDSLGEASDSLYLHTSRPDKDATAKRLYNSFTGAAQALDLNLQVKQKKVNVSNTEEPWEHEHFSKRRLLASTVSSNATPLPLFARSHIFDTSDDALFDNVAQNTQLIAEAIARHIFPTENNDLLVFSNSLSIDRELQKTWLNTIIKHPRMMPFIPEALVNGMESILKSYTTDVTKQDFVMNKNSEFIFYSEQPVTEMTVSVAKPFIFDVVLAVFVASYVFGIYQLNRMVKLFGI